MNKLKLEQVLGEEVISTKSAGGGCIGDSAILLTAGGQKYFGKSYGRNKKMIDAEYEGLAELSKSGAIRIPEVIYHDSDILILEYIAGGKPELKFWSEFGFAFAMMHKFEQKTFGFKSDNFIGSTPQINSMRVSWVDSFFENRLRFQARLAIENGFANADLMHKIDIIENKAEKLFDDTNIRASLLHGDLWSGNYMVDERGNPVLIDPAVYYGDREADLAMTKLFGTFGGDFYNSYNEEYPLLEGHEERENLYKLYHILNHLNLFGSGYYSQVNSLISYYL